MKTNLTRKFSFLFVLLISVVSFSNAQAVFEVTAPASLAGRYDIGTTSWGAPMPSICNDAITYSGDFQIVDDGTDPNNNGCEAVMNDLTGNFALIMRGACGFSLKALNAQNAGAVGVLICDQTPGGGLPPLGAGPEAPMITVPVIGLTNADCVPLRTALENNETVSFSIFYEPTGTDVVLWDEGKFDGGLDGWTTMGLSADTAIWTYAATGAVSGPLTGGLAISSPSICNGAMVFDSDLYNSTVTTQPYPTHSGELISPIIDCSTFPAVSLKFYQYQIMLNSANPAGSASFSYSLDGGDNWVPNIPIDTENVLTSVTQNIVGSEERRFFLPDLAGQPNVRIKFVWDGDFYFWALDDIQLIQPEANNLVVMENFYAIAPNFMWPESQLAPYSHLADIANIGAETQTNTVLNITITDDSGASVYSEDLLYGNVVADSLYENVPFTDEYTPNGIAGTEFTGTYTISADSADFDPSNNSISYTFMVTDSTFAKEDGADFGVRPADANWPGAEEVHSWAFGNFFHITNGSDATTPWFGASATFGIEGAPANSIITAYLYKWEDTDGNGDAETDERVRVAAGSFLADGTEIGSDFITVPLEPFGPDDGAVGQINLESGADYLLMVEFIASALGEDLEVSGGSPWDYGAQTLRSFQADIPYRPADFIAIGKPEDVTFESGTFADIVPAVRLNIAGETVINTTDLDPANIINIMPNPADDYINIEVDLVNTQSIVRVNIMDATGKLVIGNIYENVSQGTFSFDTSSLASGAYFLNFVTDEGVRTKRLMIQR